MKEDVHKSIRTFLMSGPKNFEQILTHQKSQAKKTRKGIEAFQITLASDLLDMNKYGQILIHRDGGTKTYELTKETFISMNTEAQNDIVVDKYEGEEVLVVSREFFEDLFMGNAGTMVNLMPNADTHVSDLLYNSHYMLRLLAEDDPNHKQLIPYCIINYGDQVVHYSRAKTATEARLGGKRSIGVGGHINPQTSGLAEGKDDDAFRYSMLRELLEEVGLKDKNIDKTEIIGFVNDEENEVGTVHLGIIVLITLKTPELGAIEDHLIDVRWNSLAEIQMEENMETWSKMILNHLEPVFQEKPHTLSSWAWMDYKK